MQRCSTARILCPGPSLALYVPVEFDGISIGVNRAALAVPCEVWAATDLPTVMAHARAVASCQLPVASRLSPRPRVPASPHLSLPILLTSEEAAGRVSGIWPGRVWPHGIITLESLFAFLPPHHLPWTLFTMTAAMVLAASRGAQRIEIFGCDWTPGPDWDGHTDPNTLATDSRQESRWELERGIYHRLTAELLHRGVRVSRTNAD